MTVTYTWKCSSANDASPPYLAFCPEFCFFFPDFSVCASTLWDLILRFGSYVSVSILRTVIFVLVAIDRPAVVFSLLSFRPIGGCWICVKSHHLVYSLARQ